jgi:hypothetical protein
VIVLTFPELHEIPIERALDLAENERRMSGERDSGQNGCRDRDKHTRTPPIRHCHFVDSMSFSRSIDRKRSPLTLLKAPRRCAGSNYGFSRSVVA